MQPKVSVRMVTYNHERFIGEAIDSVLCQNVNFSYEIVIGEDCSSDNTRLIVQEYQRRHPDVIRLLLNERTIGSRHNTHHTRQACRGEYIAFLDGDDYWTSPDKLQKQADILDQNPQLTICFHKAQIVFEDGRKGNTHPMQPLKPILTLEDILSENLMPSCSMMFRSHIFESIPKEFALVPFGDWPIQVCCLIHGKAGYIDEVMGVYRFHAGGTWTEGGGNIPEVWIRQIRGALLFYKAVDTYLDYRYRDLLNAAIAKNTDLLRTYRIEHIKRRLKKTFPASYKTFRFIKGKCG
jgi:glycosyltransferase involved in cell wall biosynthesis